MLQKIVGIACGRIRMNIYDLDQKKVKKWYLLAFTDNMPKFLPAVHQ